MSLRSTRCNSKLPLISNLRKKHDLGFLYGFFHIAPPPTESRKSSQSVNPSSVRAWWDFPCWVKLSHRLHSWWCPSVNSFKFQPCDHTPPGTQMLWFLIRCRRSRTCNVLRSLAGIVYGWDYDGIWSSSIPQLSFLINGNVLVQCFRSCSSYKGPRISPLALQYVRPQPSLSIITLVPITNTLEPKSYSIIPRVIFRRIPALNTLIFSK